LPTSLSTPNPHGVRVLKKEGFEIMWVGKTVFRLGSNGWGLVGRLGFVFFSNAFENACT